MKQVDDLPEMLQEEECTEEEDGITHETSGKSVTNITNDALTNAGEEQASEFLLVLITNILAQILGSHSLMVQTLLLRIILSCP